VLCPDAKILDLLEKKAMAELELYEAEQDTGEESG
jgi:hypothetical protein